MPPDQPSAEPAISVVVIFLNPGAFLEETIDSVRRQSRSGWELILVDDGSSDDGAAIARAAAEADPDRVRYLDHPGRANLGMSASRNLGLHAARGEYILYLDADDLLFPGALEILSEPLARDQTIGAACAAVLFWNWDPGLPQTGDVMHVYGPWADRRVRGSDFLAAIIASDDEFHPANCATLMRTAALRASGGFDLAMSGMFEDSAMLTAFLVRNDIYVSSRCVAAYRLHARSLSHTSAATGDYSVHQPSAARDRYLAWARRYLRDQGRLTPALRKALDPPPKEGPFARLIAKLGRMSDPVRILRRLRPHRALVADAQAAIVAFYEARGEADKAERERRRTALTPSAPAR